MSWKPTASPAMLKRRSELLWTIREFFHDRRLIEVQTPVLSRDTVVDRHLDPIVVSGESLDLAQTRGVSYYLQTSPEFGMKRLLAAGLDGIYQIGPCFRAGERGGYHNPEFTMVEWYRVGDEMQAGVRFLGELIAKVMGRAACDQASYQSVFQKYVECDPLSASLGELAAIGFTRLRVSQNWSQDRDDWLNLIFAELIQPNLGSERPMIVTHYPASQSALATLSAEDSRTAQRFELFVGGVELANGYDELLDASEFMNRNQRVNLQRVADGKTALPVHSRLLDAMHHGFPACSGCALGLDRLLMILTGASSIDAVLAFPIDNA